MRACAGAANEPEQTGGCWDLVSVQSRGGDLGYDVKIDRSSS